MSLRSHPMALGHGIQVMIRVIDTVTVKGIMLNRFTHWHKGAVFRLWLSRRQPLFVLYGICLFCKGAWQGCSVSCQHARRPKGREFL